MNEQIRQLEPAGLWNHFADLNAVPRPSKKEQKVIAFIKAFGEPALANACRRGRECDHQKNSIKRHGRPTGHSTAKPPGYGAPKERRYGI